MLYQSYLPREESDIKQVSARQDEILEHAGDCATLLEQALVNGSVP
jgi:hypothetical protein